jgi:anti-anti-sigma regulatory factor
MTQTNPAAGTEIPAETVAVEDPGSRVIVLADALDIVGAGSLKASLCRALEDEGQLVVDAGGVEHADASGIQLLYAFTRDARKAGRRVRWRAVSPALTEAIEVLGLVDELSLHD